MVEENTPQRKEEKRKEKTGPWPKDEIQGKHPPGAEKMVTPEQNRNTALNSTS